MDDISKNNSFPDAIVLYANYASFSSGKIIHFDKVQSRMFLWCKSGRGEVTVNGNRFSFSAGAFLFIPWNHKICYKADNDDPFLVAGIHIIPALKIRGNIKFNIFHTPKTDIEEYNYRKDSFIPGFSSVFAGNLAEYNSLGALAEYIVLWFQRENKEEFMARILAQALIHELIMLKKTSNPLPRLLNEIIDYINKNIESKIEVSDLTAIGACSASTVFRLFRINLKCTPVNWILKMKVNHAAELLKKTDMRIGEIGGKVGIDDPYYFSRVFKKFMGITAKQYRNHNSLLTHNI